MRSRPFTLLTALLLVSLPAVSHCEKTGDEVPPWNHPQFRSELSHFEYYHGEWNGNLYGSHSSSSEVVSDFAGFTRWSFKSLRLDGKWYLVIGAGKDTDYSMLHEKLPVQNELAKRLAVRSSTSGRSFRHLMTLHIPTQMPQVKEFDFAYVTGKSTPFDGPSFIGSSDTLVPFFNDSSIEGDDIFNHLSKLGNSQLVALRWVKSFKEKNDWVFAIVCHSNSEPEFVPIGPRPSSPTTYSIRIEKEELRIEVNRSLVLMRPSPWNGDTPLYRHAGINLYQEPIQDLEANVFFSQIL